jgi:methyltransferase (TIGR00027 family)
MGAVLPVESVADTALLTAFCRAVETERPDAHFHDPYARMLAGDRGEQLFQRFTGGDLTAAGCAARTCMIDTLIAETIRMEAIDTVLNLGAGLDTRPYRLPIAPSVSWIEVDNSAVLAYKERTLRGISSFCALESVTLDITEVDARRSLLARIGGAATRVLVVTEGLLVYMVPDEVASLACDLHNWPAFQWWLTDMISSNALRLMQSKYCESPNTGCVSMQFAPESGSEFFRSCGWETDEFRSCLEEGERLNRLFLSKSLLSSGIANDQRQMLLKLYAVARLRRAGPNGGA